MADEGGQGPPGRPGEEPQWGEGRVGLGRGRSGVWRACQQGLALWGRSRHQCRGVGPHPLTDSGGHTFPPAAGHCSGGRSTPAGHASTRPQGPQSAAATRSGPALSVCPTKSGRTFPGRGCVNVSLAWPLRPLAEAAPRGAGPHPTTRRRR